jgi:hypothetical protein
MNLKKLYLLALILLTQQVLFGQMYDHTWFTGYDEFPGVPGYGHAQLLFEDSTVIVEQTTLAFNFESTVATMSDKNGNLLFYTNGCSIANRNHEVMPNGAGLNPGEISDLVCSSKGYIVPQGAMVLPDPGDSSRYYLFHMGASNDPVRKLQLGPLYYSIVDISLQNGMGDVVSKNNVLLDGDLGSFTAMRHGNRRDWWVIVPEFGNRTWHTFLLSPQGIEAQAPQNQSLVLPDCEKYMATAASPVGRHIANWGDCKLTVFRFNTCDGAIQDPLEFAAPDHWIPGGGLAFSSTGRYLYATSQNVLFRVDVLAWQVLDTMRFSFDPYNQSPYDVRGNTFHHLVNGPDDMIYGNIPSRAKHLHVIKSPDSYFKDDIDFQAQGVKLPVTGVRTLPHLPNYRFNLWFSNPPCDTLGITPTTQAWVGATPKVRPNPAQDILYLDLPTPEQVASVHLTDALGRVVYSSDQWMPSISLAQLPEGVYYLMIRQARGAVFSEKVVVRR